MHLPTALLLLILLALGCRAAEPTPPTTSPASQPTGLTATITITHDYNCIAEITIANNTDHPLSLGHYDSYALIRTDTTPPATISASPANAMHPMYRLLMQPGDSRTSKMTLSDKPLPPGHYQFTLTYPKSMFPTPLQRDFDIPAPTTERN
ncbi:MAG TPA: hypothetical protein VM008_10415 [Phycisphaerae bacterium]|nr:hypothetical protein [Phycisphaerae bacterium]